eukprot:jgi/Ulvmu1/808/UM010_0182.1
MSGPPPPPPPRDPYLISQPPPDFARRMAMVLHTHLSWMHSATQLQQVMPQRPPAPHSSLRPPNSWHQQGFNPEPRRGRDRILSYNRCEPQAGTNMMPPPAPASPASARSSRSSLPDVAMQRSTPCMHAAVPAAAAATPRNAPMSRMHGHLPPAAPAMMLLDHTAQVLRARTAKSVAATTGARGGLAPTGSCSSASTGADFDCGGMGGGQTRGDEGWASQITGKRGLTNVPLLTPSAPKAKRRRHVYKPYSVHAPRYKPPLVRKVQNSNALRRQLMGKGKKH